MTHVGLSRKDGSGRQSQGRITYSTDCGQIGGAQKDNREKLQCDPVVYSSIGKFHQVALLDYGPCESGVR